MDWVDTINNIRAELLFFTFLFAVLFFQIQQANEKTLLSLLLITLWLVGLGYYLQYKSTKVDGVDRRDTALLEAENDKKLEVSEIVSPNYYIKAAPKKGLKYLKNNETLMNIAKDLIFVKTFDAQKYQDMLVYMNSYQKVYMYILAERYQCKSYISTFLDLRENILEIMYQYYVVVPSNFKHIYGISPYMNIEKNIHEFLKLSRMMIDVLENFCKLDLKEHYFPTTNPMPHDKYNENSKKYILP
jgi:hypothetical protein